MKKFQSIVFFGTHELAPAALETLAALDIVPRLIVTRPEAGFAVDGAEPPPHPVRAWARERRIEVFRSRRAAEPELREKIAGLEPDLLVVVDYGRPLPADLLETADRGAIEVHPSLLPKLRGAHALRAALASGGKKTGISVIRVNEEPWGGPILLQEELEIGERDTFGELLPAASKLAGELLTAALHKLSRGKGKTKGRAQKEDNASSVPGMGGRHRKVPWSLEAPEIYDRLRAYSPPGLVAYLSYRPVAILSGIPMEWVNAPYGTTGTYLGMRQGKLTVLCSNGTVFGIERLCRPGATAQGASDFARAEGLRVGQSFI